MRRFGTLSQAEYSHAHYLVYRQFGKPKHCTECGTTDPIKRYEWANQTGNYFDPSDYKRMCKLCHARFDAARRVESEIPAGLLTLDVVAKYFRVHQGTVRRWIKVGLLNCHRIGSRVLLEQKELDRFLENCVIPTSPHPTAAQR